MNRKSQVSKRQSKPQTQLRLAPPDKRRLSALAQRANRTLAEQVALLVRRAAPWALSAEARELLKNVRAACEPGPEATKVERAALAAHCRVGEALVRQHDGYVPPREWLLWVKQTCALQHPKPVVRDKQSSVKRDAAEAPGTGAYERELFASLGLDSHGQPQNGQAHDSESTAEPAAEASAEPPTESESGLPPASEIPPEVTEALLLAPREQPQVSEPEPLSNEARPIKTRQPSKQPSSSSSKPRSPNTAKETIARQRDVEESRRRPRQPEPDEGARRREERRRSLDEAAEAQRIREAEEAEQERRNREEEREAPSRRNAADHLPPPGSKW